MEEKIGVPLELSMALLQDMDALRSYANLSTAQKHGILARARTAQNRDQIKKILEDIK